MKTCRLCGTADDLNWRRRKHHIPEFCFFCNHRYSEYERNLRVSSRQNLNRLSLEEYNVYQNRVLIDFIARRLHILALRARQGLSITLCEAITPRNARCSKRWDKEVRGHKFCTRHAQAFRRGRVNRFAREDTTWVEKVMAFINNNGEIDGRGPP
jgi:hypothetical protein